VKLARTMQLLSYMQPFKPSDNPGIEFRACGDCSEVWLDNYQIWLQALPDQSQIHDCFCVGGCSFI